MGTSVRTQQRLIRVADAWASVWRWGLLAGGTVLGVYLILERGIIGGVLAAAAAGVLVIGAVLSGSRPMAIPLLVLPVLFVSARVGVGPADLSASDVALAAAFASCILLGKRPYSPAMRAMLWWNLVYQFTTLFTIIVNPYTANTVEWFHAWLLISGALVVGWALGRAGHARLALTIMLYSALALAVGTFVTAVFQYASGNFGEVYPNYPFPMHKNFAGCVMGFMAIVAFVNPPWLRWSRSLQWWSFWLLLAAIIIAQSRQALIGLVVAIIFVVLRRGVHGASRLFLLLVIPAAWMIALTVIEQIESQNRFNSLYQRLDWFKEVYAFWKHSPFFGHGLRYWYTDVSARFQPPQAELEVVASTGVVGLLGFAAMWLGMFVVLWRIDPRYGTLAIAAIGSRLVQAQFDLFWVAAQVSIPFVIAGVCLGALAFDEERRRREDAVDGVVRVESTSLAAR